VLGFQNDSCYKVAKIVQNILPTLEHELFWKAAILILIVICKKMRSHFILNTSIFPEDVFKL
jgi:hypothetical protein